MLQGLETIRMARALTAHAEARSRVIAGNVANADTPGYRARDLAPFESSFRQGGQLRLQRTNPRHLASSHGVFPGRLVEGEGERAPNGNSVSLEDEMVKMAENKRQHELSVSIYRSSLKLLRTALGRRM